MKMDEADRLAKEIRGYCPECIVVEFESQGEDDVTIVVTNTRTDTRFPVESREDFEKLKRDRELDISLFA